MTFLGNLEGLLRTKLVTLSGIPVTVASLLTCLLIFFVSVLLARFAGRAIVRAMTRKGRSAGVASSMAKIVRYTITAVGVFVALDTLGFNLTAVFAGSAVLLVGIGFGLQNVAQNFISGVILLVERPVKEGDFVRVGDINGTIVRIGLRATMVLSRDEVAVIVPNSEFTTTSVVNYSVPSDKTRVAVNIGVAYGSDTSLVATTLEAVVRRVEDVLATPAPEVRFVDFGESSLDFRVMVWIPDPREDLRIKSLLRFEIERSLREAGIAIPFPQRDVHLKPADAAGKAAA